LARSLTVKLAPISHRENKVRSKSPLSTSTGLINLHIERGEITLGDKYATGTAAVVGPSGHAHDLSFNYRWRQTLEAPDSYRLTRELSELRLALEKLATDPNQDAAVGEIASAEIALRENQGLEVMKHLLRAGKWALDAATNIGTSVAAEAINKAMGLKKSRHQALAFDLRCQRPKTPRTCSYSTAST